MNKQTFSQFVQALNKFIDEYEGNHIQRYAIADREAGNIIDDGLSLDEAEMRIVDYEESDKRDGLYVPNFYEIKKQD
jgi:hypothetical protein